MIFNDIKTDPALLAQLRALRYPLMTAEERREQLVSFVYGMLDADSGIARERVRDMLADHFGEGAKHAD